MSRTTITPEAHPPIPPALENGFGDSLIPLEQAADTTGALRRYWFVVLLCVAVAVGAAVAVSLTSPKRYDSTAKLWLANAEPADVVQQATSARSLDPERDLNTWVELVKTNDVAQPVLRKLKLAMSAPSLLSEVSASAEGNSNVIAIRARDRSPVRAAAIANAFADQYVAFRRDLARSLYGSAARSAEARLATLPPAVRSKPIGRELGQRADALAVASNLQTGGVRLIDRATASLHPATPRTRFTVAIAALIGLVLGGVFALALDRPRRR
jgi:polysaccharide biosynthesis transport protein